MSERVYNLPKELCGLRESKTRPGVFKAAHSHLQGSRSYTLSRGSERMIYTALLPAELFTQLEICPVAPLHSPLVKHQLKLSSGLQRTFAQELREH